MSIRALSESIAVHEFFCHSERFSMYQTLKPFLPLLALAGFSLVSCGDSAEELKASDLSAKYKSEDAAAKETDPLLEADLDAMSSVQLSSFLDVMKTRNSKEASDLKALKSINQSLCQKLFEVRKTCAALSPLMGSSLSRLGCSEEQLKNDIRMTVNGSEISLIADNLYESNRVSSNAPEISFKSMNGSKESAMRFIEVSELILKSHNGNISDPGSIGFSLTINGAVAFDSNDLERKSDSELKIKLDKFIDLNSSRDCNVTQDEINQIKAAAVGGA